MRKNSTLHFGALHPILFFLFVYGVSLFLALFVCRTVFYSINNDPSTEEIRQQINNHNSSVAATSLTASVFK